MSDKRAEFNVLRKKWLKENGWPGYVCARCGEFSKSTHLHHIQELVYGGENTPDNLIPLCGDCHREWDDYPESYPFEKFLVTMPSRILCVATEMVSIPGAEMFSTTGRMALCGTIFRGENMVRANAEVLEDLGWLCRDLMYAQNRVFSKYPYSDETWRNDMIKVVYGDIDPNKERRAV